MKGKAAVLMRPAAELGSSECPRRKCPSDAHSSTAAVAGRRPCACGGSEERNAPRRAIEEGSDYSTESRGERKAAVMLTLPAAELGSCEVPAP